MTVKAHNKVASNQAGQEMYRLQVYISKDAASRLRSAAGASLVPLGEFVTRLIVEHFPSTVEQR